MLRAQGPLKMPMKRTFPLLFGETNVDTKLWSSFQIVDVASHLLAYPNLSSACSSFLPHSTFSHFFILTFISLSSSTASDCDPLPPTPIAPLPLCNLAG